MALTPDEARREIDQIQNDPEQRKAWTDDRHPEHRQTMKRLGKLYEDAYPEWLENKQ